MLQGACFFHVSVEISGVQLSYATLAAYIPGAACMFGSMASSVCELTLVGEARSACTFCMLGDASPGMRG